MKKITLTFSERLQILSILNEFRGNLDKVVTVMDDIKKIKLSDKELKDADGQILNDGKTYTWNIKKQVDIDIELDKVTTTFIKDYVNKKNEAGVFGLSDIGLLEICKKIN